MSHEDVTMEKEGNQWICRAYTHNNWSDVFISKSSTPEKAIRKVIKNVEKDGDDLWLISQLEKLILKRHD